MAGFQKKIKYTEQSSCSISFECDLNPSSRGVIINELIKYCMYEREQIPLPFENLKQDFDRNENIRQQNKMKDYRQQQVLKKVEERKSHNAVSSLEQLFENLIRLFERFPEVHQVMILFGGTVVSPKETYLVNLPPVCPDAEPLKDKSFIRHLYRQLITQDMLGNVKCISPTTMTLLVRAPRDCRIEWFLPKPAFKIPQKCKQFVFNISCNRSSSASHNLTQHEEGFDISGIELLDVNDTSSTALLGSSNNVFEVSGADAEESMDIDDPEMSSAEKSQKSSNCIYSTKFFPIPGRLSSSKSSGSSSTSMQPAKQNNIFSSSSDSGFDTDSAQEDMIWFQSPVVVKGYRSKSSNKC